MCRFGSDMCVIIRSMGNHQLTGARKIRFPHSADQKEDLQATKTYPVEANTLLKVAGMMSTHTNSCEPSALCRRIASCML